MPLQKNLNVSPYYADYSPLSDYYKVLFKAGYPIQARELTNSQLMLQNQVEQFMSRFLKEGDQVVPGEFGYAKSSYVRLSSITQGATAQDFVGSTVTGVVSGVKAKVYFATAETSTDDVTFYVNYESSGTTATQNTFIEGETLESDTVNRFTAVVGVNGISKPINISPLGQGSLFTVKEGYYYVDGSAVRCDEQTITLDKYGTFPTYAVGFLVGEEFVTSAEDPALLDNSQGSTNFAAPGADRLKITLTLQKRAIDDDFANPNFIMLGKIEAGNFLGKPDQRTKWSWLEEILAKRTFDESGDYIVTEFPVERLEYANTEFTGQSGVFNADAANTYPPVPGSGSTTRLTATEADGKFAIKVAPGEAYVQGYEIGFTNPVYLFGDKPRTQNFRQDANVQITDGYHLTISSLNSVPDILNINAEIDTVGLETIRTFRNFIDGHVGDATQIDSQGFVEPFNIGNEPPVTYHILTVSTISTINTSQYSVVYQGTNSCVVTLVPGAPVPIRGGNIGSVGIAYAQVVNPTPTGLVTPRYVMPNAPVENPQDNPGTLGYNSTFDLGITAAEYFTEFFLVNNNSTNYDVSWSIGDLVYGEQTGSFGVVEQGSIPQRLIVSNITGEFAPGENVYQEETDKVSTIAKQGEVVNFVFTDFGTAGATVSLGDETSIKVRAIGAEITLTKDVDYTFNTTANELVPTQAGREKLLNFPYPAGSFLAQRINYTLETFPNAVTGYAYQVPGKIQSSVSKAKSFFAPQPSQPVNFTSDIAIRNNNDSEIVALANGSLFSGNSGENFVTCDNFNGDPADQIEFGDIVTFVDDTGVSVNKLVAFATKPVGYGRERDSAFIYFTTTLERAVNGKTVQRIRIKKKGEASETLIYQLPQRTVASLQSDPLASGINYAVMGEFVVQLEGGTNVVTINTNKQNETFINNLSQTSITVASLPSDPNDVQGILGRQLSVASAVSANSGRQISFTLDKTLATNSVLKVIIPVYVTNALAKVKTINKDQTMTVTAATAAKSAISLGVADVTVVSSIKMAPDGLEVRDNYLLDDGQRDNVYELSRLVLKPGAPKATGELTITYNYFTHSGDGDFFSVDSYTSDGGVNYAEIPVFKPSKTLFAGSNDTANIFLELRDCIDFRPIVNTTGATPSILPVITDDRDATTSTNFLDGQAYDGNAVVPRFPVRGSLFICDLAYYMPRIDSIFLERDGALTLKQGVADDEPVAPPALATGIRLYDIFLPPYTFSIKGSNIRKFNFKRFTMADIAGIDARVARLQDLVTLSILEQSALNMQVRDAVTGLARFKNGIVVDRFADHSLGAVGQEQYKNSIDPVTSHLRAGHYTQQVELIEQNQTNLQRQGDGYRKTGPLITVDYESLRFMQNPYATRFMNLQPYTVFTYDGNLVLTPSVDTFQEVTRLPDLVVENNFLFDAMVNLTDTMEDAGFGTVWGEWEAGASSTSSSTNVIRGSQAQINGALGALAVQGVDVSAVSERVRNRVDNGSLTPIRVRETTTSQEFTRTQTQTSINVSTARVDRTSYGDRVTDVQLARTMRTIPVRFTARRLKPNTRYYLFFDEIDISEWVSPDKILTDFPDGVSRYAFGGVGSAQIGFGQPILSDDLGDINATFLIPNGRPPVAGTIFTGSLADVQYQTDGPTRSFNTGTRKVRITSSPTNEQDLELVEGFADASFVASGVLLDKQETIVATRVPEFSTSSRVTATETRTETSTSQEAEYFDPVAQSFLIDENNPEGLFVTELDVFFKTKDSVEGVEAYLVTTDGQVPTDQILPLSRVVKQSDSTLRVIVTLADGQNGATLDAGTIITGSTSGSTGVIKATQSFDSPASNATTNVGNTVYNVVLNNYDGEFIEGEEFVPAVTPAETATFTIVTDTYEVEDVRLTNLGSGYHNPQITFSAPQLPGGTTATATVSVGINGTSSAGDIVYKVTMIDKGSGYTQIPSVSFSDVLSDDLIAAGATAGVGATGEVLVSDGVASVDMGVSTSEDATAATKFKFPAPVYLLGDTNYAFVLKAPTSLNYNVWTSKMGENQVGTEVRVIHQPNLGSLFKSQNGGLWTEDQTQDVKFVMYRAEFETAAAGELRLNNAPVALQKLPLNPIETNADGSDLTSSLFGANPKVIRVVGYYHGLLSGDLVAISGIQGDPGGIPNAEINTVHTVIDAGLTYFTVKVSTSAVNNERDGGQAGFITPNKPYELINIYTGAMALGTTSLSATNRATESAGVTGYNSLNNYRLNIPNNINLAESYYYNGAKVVANQLNESKFRGASELRGNKSLETSIRLQTFSRKVSPVIDLDRTNAIVVRNLIDNPLADASAQGTQQAVLTIKAQVDITFAVGSSLTYTKDGISYSARVKAYNQLTRKLTVIGDNLDKLVGATFSNSTLNSVGVDVVITNGILFIPETSPDGSVHAKWISRQFTFENPCDGIEMKLAVCQYSKTSVRAYYRPRAIGFEGDITQENWTPFNPEQSIDTISSTGQTISQIYPGLPDDVNNISVRNSVNVNPLDIPADGWRNLTFSVQDIPAFDSLQVKIVMTSDNPALAPLIDDMQLVCTE